MWPAFKRWQVNTTTDNNTAWCCLLKTRPNFRLFCICTIYWLCVVCPKLHYILLDIFYIYICYSLFRLGFHPGQTTHSMFALRIHWGWAIAVRSAAYVRLSPTFPSRTQKGSVPTAEHQMNFVSCGRSVDHQLLFQCWSKFLKLGNLRSAKRADV